MISFQCSFHIKRIIFYHYIVNDSHNSFALVHFLLYYICKWYCLLFGGTAYGLNGLSFVDVAFVNNTASRVHQIKSAIVIVLWDCQLRCNMIIRVTAGKLYIWSQFWSFFKFTVIKDLWGNISLVNGTMKNITAELIKCKTKGMFLIVNHSCL